MRFIIHIGTHKTATSSIQAFCEKNRKLLLDKGICYPVNKSGSRNHNFLACDIAFGRYAAADSHLKDMVNQARKSNAKTVLISGESFYAMNSFFFKLYQRPCENYWLNERLAVSRLKEFLGEHDVKIVCYLRRQDFFLESIYNQCIKHTPGYSGLIREFKVLMYESLSYYRILSIWAECFGQKNMVVRNYEQAVKSSPIIDFVNSALSIESLEEFELNDSHVNERLNRDVLEYKRILNRITLPVYDQIMLMKACQIISQEMGENHTFQNYLAFDERIELISDFSIDNPRIIECFNVDADGFTLADDCSDNSIYPGLSVEAATEIACRYNRFIMQPSVRLELFLRKISFGLKSRYKWGRGFLDYVRHARKLYGRLRK